MTRQLILSVLDQSPIRHGGTAAQALRETVELAQAAERFGYRRFWVAEHHNTGGYAGVAPEILIGQIAAHTTTIRVGSGGVMLSHYSALKVAETFRLLASFFPGRIDSGIGRAPGSDQLTAQALAYPRRVADINEFPNQVVDVLSFMANTVPEEHPFSAIEAQAGPMPESIPEVWLLGSSGYSAQLAGMLGLPFAFADFFGSAGDLGPRAAELYRQRFEPSDSLAEPKVAAAVHVICADTAERARHIAASRRVSVYRMRTGQRSNGIIPPDEAEAIEQQMTGLPMASFNKYDIEGDPELVREQLQAAANRYDTDELIVATNCYSFSDRLRSYELVAQVTGQHALGVKQPVSVR